MSAECRFESEIAAYLAGELNEREKVAFLGHLEGCPVCRAELEATQGILNRLSQVPVHLPSRDLAPLILERIGTEPRSLSYRWLRVAALAASLALLATGVAFTDFGVKNPVASSQARETSVARALDWLCHQQEADGSWAPEKWGGLAQFKVALSALPMLAILSSDTPSAEQLAAVERSAAWLSAQQNASGGFGPSFQGSPYNQSIATFALLRAYQRQPGSVPKPVLDAALGAILKRQTADGGWGYLRSPFADRSITEWHFEALRIADSLGWDVRASLERARVWLAAHREGGGAEPADSPSALLAQSASVSPEFDFHRTYFAVAALRQGATASHGGQRAAIRQALLTSQSAIGAETGSWAPNDRWGRAGGRLYSTALASLSLANL